MREKRKEQKRRVVMCYRSKSENRVTVWRKEKCVSNVIKRERERNIMLYRK